MSFAQRFKDSWAVLTASSAPTTPSAASSTTPESTDPSTWGKFTQVAGLFGFLFVVAVAAFLKIHDITPLRAANDAIAINADASTEQARLAVLRTKEQEETKREMLKRGLVPEGAVQVVKVPEQAAQLSRNVVPLRTFDCSTEEAQSVGFARRDVQVVSAVNGYQFHPGCALVRLSAKIHSLSGENYQFVQEVGNSSYNVCGTIGMNDGVPRSPEECINWLNNHIGQTVKLVIQDGGNVIINN